MQRTYTLCSFIAKTAKILAFLFLATPAAFAQQVTVFPASGCSGCDGELSYVHSSSATISWFDQSGSLLQTDASATSTLTGLCPGLYLMEVVDDSQTIQEWVTVNTITASAGSSGLQYGCANGEAMSLNEILPDADPGGTWTDVFGTPVADPDNVSAAFPETQTYLYTIDGGGCPITARIDVIFQENADPGLTTTYLICASYEPFPLTEFLAGSPDPNGQWFNAAAAPFDGIYDPSTMETGLFTYSIDTVAGCEAVFSTLYVIENPEADPGIPTDVLVCDGGIPFSLSAQIDGTPEMGGTWETSDGDPLPDTFDPSVYPEGSYFYTVQGLTPCPDETVEVNVIYTAALDAGSDGMVELCEDAPETGLQTYLGGSPMPGGNWIAPDGSEFSPVLDPSLADSGLYTYQLDGVGCETVSASVEVVIESLPNAGSDGLIELCESADPLDLNSELDPDVESGMWSGPNLDGSLFTWASSGSWTVTYSVGEGICPQDQANWTVDVVQAPQAGPDAEDFFCELPGALDLMSYFTPVNASDLVISDEDGTPIATDSDLPAGYYELTLTASGVPVCPDDQATLIIEIVEPAFLPYEESALICDTQLPFDLQETVDTDPEWDGSWWDESGNQLTDPMVVQGGMFSFEVNNHPLCPPSVFSLGLNVVSQDLPDTPEALAICFDAPVVNLDEYLGVSPGSGIWTLESNPVASELDPSNAQSGDYTYEIPEAGPCPSSSLFFPVTIDPGFEFDAGDDLSICADISEIQLGQDPVPDCTYYWTPDDLLSDATMANPVFHVADIPSASGTWDFQVTASNGVCIVEDEVSIEVLPLPVLEVSDDLGICQGESFTLSASGANSYVWTDQLDVDAIPLSLSSELVYTAIGSTIYQVVGSAENGCSTSESIAVTVWHLPQVSADPAPAQGCSPVLWSPNAVNDDSHWLDWYINGEWVSSDENFTWPVSDAGLFDVSLVATSDEGCTTTLGWEENIEVWSYPDASFQFSPDAVSLDSPYLEVEETGDDAFSWNWTVNGQEESLEQSFSYIYGLDDAPASLEICLLVSNEFGCTDTLCKDVPVENTHWIFVPNAFTPDNDGINEVFGPVVNGIAESGYRFMIFDRWGELLFESDNPGDFWTGNVRGGSHYVQEGIYSWVVELRDAFTAEQHRYTGHVTVIR